MLDKEYLSVNLREIKRLNGVKKSLTDKKLSLMAHIEEIEEQIKDAEESIEAHARANMQEFKGNKLTLPEGVLKFTQSTKIIVDPELEKLTMDTLKEMGLVHCIKVKESLLLSALGNLDEATLSKLGVEKTTTQSFSIKLQA
ncbi:host-nuclease inhibitor Gam family protein [Helicobacter suis]|uniref:host-nuclease inhibitor Gam family protein n=1 Tax=Helicobacter suis TaxID=104628 RepID=UPI0013D68A5C|nr:host-nuclease inhibitor Gam family protein [Helicobacter suis]